MKEDDGRESCLTEVDLALIQSRYRALFEARRSWKVLLARFGHLSPTYLYRIGKGRHLPKRLRPKEP